MKIPGELLYACFFWCAIIVPIIISKLDAKCDLPEGDGKE